MPLPPSVDPGPGQTYLNLSAFGAVGDGINDDTAAIQTCIDSLTMSSGVISLPPGTFSVSSPIVLSTPDVQLRGQGYTTVIQPTASFSGTEVIRITGNYCSVSDLQIEYADTNYSHNPAANGIQITGSVASRIENVFMTAINGWIVQSTGGSSQPNYNTVLRNVRGYQCAQGFHLLGVSGSGYGGIHFVSDCYSNQTQNGDCWFIEDFLDLVANNIFGENAASCPGHALHIKGNCNALFFSNFDLGPYPGPANNDAVLIESDGAGDPGRIVFSGGIIEGGSGAGVYVTGGYEILAQGVHFFNNGTYGVNLQGGDAIQFTNCSFANNGTSGSSGRYDLQNGTGGNVVFDSCYFRTAQGTTSGKTNAVVNDTGGNMTMTNCAFKGTGYSGGNIFAGYPKIVRNCQGFNPIGDIGAPAIGASPYTAGSQSVDYTAYIKGGTVSAIAVAGVTTGLTLATGGFVTVRVLAGQTITLTYSAVPTWKWLGD